MPEQPKECWCYICDGRVPIGRDEEGDHILAALSEETTDADRS